MESKEVTGESDSSSGHTDAIASLVTKERIFFFFLGWSVVHVCPSYHQCHTVLYPDVHLRDT